MTSSVPTTPLIFPGGASQTALLEALDQNESYFELAIEVSRLGRKLRADAVLGKHVNIDGTALALQQGSGNN